jgi:hypothetical protein
MKTNFYILLILLLSFSFVNAQSTTKAIKVETNNIVIVSQEEKQVVTTVENTTDTVNENEVILIDASQVKESIARSNSDIRLYFNRLRNVDNLNILFPKANKAVKA